MAPISPPPIGGLADELAAVVALREHADRLEDAAVERALRDGWSWSEIAEALGVTDRTVRRDWVKARAWLYRALAERGSANALAKL